MTTVATAITIGVATTIAMATTMWSCARMTTNLAGTIGTRRADPPPHMATEIIETTEKTNETIVRTESVVTVIAGNPTIVEIVGTAEIAMTAEIERTGMIATQTSEERINVPKIEMTERYRDHRLNSRRVSRHNRHRLDSLPDHFRNRLHDQHRNRHPDRHRHNHPLDDYRLNHRRNHRRNHRLN